MTCKKFLLTFGIICYIFLNTNVSSKQIKETKNVLSCDEETVCALSNQCTYKNIQGNNFTNWDYQQAPEKLCTQNFIRPSNVFFITIIHSHIESLPKGLFTVYSNATTLTAPKNGIQCIKNYDFYGGVKLQNINLAFNNINAVPNMVFASNPNLITLNLSDNKISHIEEKSFYGLKKLKSLDLSRNKIGNLEPNTFDELIDVVIILLEGNMLKLLSEDIFVRNKLLKNVGLSKNSVETMALQETIRAPNAYKFIKRYIRSTSTDQQLDSNTELVNATHRKNEIQEILDLLQEGEETIKYSTNQDVILFLGNTGSGKSTFSQFITGNGANLISQEILNDTDEFIIIDRNNKVSSNSTITSHTIFPELIVDTDKNIAFYDCPGFSDTRSAAHDIAATYFIKKLIDSANAIKMIFFVSYPSVRQGVDRLDFMLSVQHAVTMIKNIDKFKDSIALIVTKVDNNYVKKGRSLVSDKNVIESIAKFLKIVRDELEKNILKDPIFNENAVKFIDILLEKDGKYFTKIGIFRRPDESGVLSNISLLQDGKKTVGKILYKNLQFSQHDEGDFGYTISADSLNYVTTLVEKINMNIASKVVNLGKEIEKHYSTQEKQLNDIQELYNIFKLGYDFLSETKKETSKFVELQDFIRHITKNINDLNISVSRKNLLNIEIYAQYLKFLKDVSGQHNVKPLVWAQGLTNIVQYLSDSQKWYDFLIRLYTILSKYEIQKDVNKYGNVTNDLKYQIANNEYQKYFTESFKIFLEQVIGHGQDSETEYNNLRNIKLDTFKLKFLNKILDLTLKDNMRFSCEKQKLILKGQFIKLSDVAKVNCNQPKFIEIFALNKVFIDTNFNKVGEKISLSIIAPTWDIIGGPQIILDGTPGMAHNISKAGNGIGSGSRGEDGKPGLPGGNAGQFLGIGRTFDNDKYLSIFAIGGKGGQGQTGGDGFKGKDGENPSLPSSNEEEECSQRKFIYENTGSNHSLGTPVVVNFIHIYRFYNVYGTNGSKGGNGGDGGIGGMGGNSGYINIIGLDNNPEILVHTAKGANGVDGIGGKGGKGGKNGKIIQAKCSTRLDLYVNMIPTFIRNHWTELSRSEGGTALTGESGINGYNKKGIKYRNKIVQNINGSHTINNYKNYLRENLSGNIRESFLREFINQLGNHNSITDLYDTLRLVNEFQGLEDQFYKLRTEIPFVPYYKSLLNRITQIASKPANNEKSIENKKVLSYLYTATLSKICSINNNVANNLVIDLQEYLKLVILNVNNLNKYSKTVTINYYKKNFQQALKEKTNEAESFIDDEIIPEINNIFNQINHKIELLIHETFTLQNTTIEEKIKLKKQQQELEDSLVLRKILGITKIASQFLSFLGLTGAAASAVIGGGVTIIETLGLSEMGTPDIRTKVTLPLGIESSIKYQLRNKQQLFTKQLHDVEQKLAAFYDTQPSSDIEKIKKKISDTKLKLDQDKAKGLDLEYVDKIDTVRKEVVQVFENLKKSLEKQKTDTNIEDKLLIVSNVQNILSISEISIYTYIKIRKHQGQIDKLSHVIRQADTKLIKLEQYENAIYKIIIPKYRDLKNHLAMTKETLQDQSHVVLDISKWKIQNTIKGVKFKMRKMTEGFDVQEDFRHCIDKLLEGITVMVNIYDRIEDYREKAELATYIADINSNRALQITVNDTELNDAIDNLNLIIQSNLVLEKYETAMNALRQHIFPFTDFYLAEFNLPSSLESNNPNNVTSLVVSKLKDLKSKVSESTVTINKHDEHIYNDVMFNSHSSEIAPFLVWQHSKNKNTISKLLEGEEITIKADITQGLDKNAIKFNEIGIYFKLANETIQHEFDKELKYFQVTMTHLGNSYYRCDNKFYVITSDRQVIKYSFRKNNNGEPFIKNNVYDKIKKNHPVLSPYTMWKIQLNNTRNNFSKLAKYKNQAINLELEGRGQYIDQGINICNDNLNKYYTLEDSTQ